MLAGEMVVALVLLFALSVATRETPLFLLTLALLVAAALSRLWERFALRRVEYRRRFSRVHAAFGEKVELEIEVVNRKPLPLSWLEVEDEMPSDLKLLHGRLQPSHKPHRAVLANLLALRPYERLRRRYVLSCTARGEYIFGPVRLLSGDLFGFAICERTLEISDTLVVYPRVVPLTELGLPATQPLGELRAQSWIFEDPSRMAGAREYRPGESLRRIHWPATARSQQMQSRLYEATTDHKLGIFLNAAAAEDSSETCGYDPDVLEMSITTAASIAMWGLEQGYQVGLYTNGFQQNGHESATVEPGRSIGQEERILLALGRLQRLGRERFEDLLSRQGRQLPFGTTAVIVSAALSPEAVAAVQGIRTSGRGVTVILTGRHEMETPVHGVVVRRIGPPEDWRDTPRLSPVVVVTA